MAEGKIMELPATSVAVLRNVMETAIANRQAIDIKKDKISGTIKLVKQKITVINDEKTDKYVNDLIVIAKNTQTEIEGLRKAYTSKVRDWLDTQIAPENELKMEIASLIQLRNDRAKRLAEEANEKNNAIQAEKNKKEYEAEVKGALKLSVEGGLFALLQKLDSGLDVYFMANLTATNGPQIEAKFKGMKPALKEDAFLSWFQIDFDIKRMSQAEYDDLIKRAKGYWIYETINDKYIAEAKTIIQKWIDKIPQRIKELEIIAKGGEQGERVKKIAEEREANERAETAKAHADKTSAIERTVNEEVQGEQMTANFKAQASTQQIEKPSGAREKKIYVVDNPGDMLRVGKFIGAIVAHLIPCTTIEEKMALVLQYDKDGKAKLDKDGDYIYTDGVQFWLDQLAAKVKYKADIEGIHQKIKISTVAKK